MVGDKKGTYTSLDAFVIDNLFDPAILIDAVETVIYENLVVETTQVQNISSKEKNLLILDLNRNIALKTVYALKQKGYKTVVLYHIKHFLRYIQQLAPRLIVISTGDKSSIEPLLRETKLDDTANNTPKMIVTDCAPADDEIGSETFQRLSDDTLYIPHDISEDELVQKMLALADRAAME